MIKSNMYNLSVKQWNPFIGCAFGCVYCKPSFQAQMKRQKHNCEKCYNYEPHCHPERLNQPLPRTRYMQFIFTCATGDIAFCPVAFLNVIQERIKKEKDKTFLIQSKWPDVFGAKPFSKNTIIGTTIETNRSLFDIGTAPQSYKRYETFLKIEHPLKMVTIEPIMEFDLSVMLNWITTINPCMVWIGYDTKNCGLPEPSTKKVKQLHWEISKREIPVFLKRIKEIT